MAVGPSTLSLLGSVAYLGAMAAAAAAAWSGHQHSRPHLEIRHWVIMAGFLLILAAMRYWQVEEVLRQDLRKILISDGLYQGRRAFQSVLAVLCLVSGVIAAIFFVQRLLGTRRGLLLRLVWWSRLAMLGMAGLIALRLISLHAIDALLYGGFRLNWVLDLGMTGVMGGAALIYAFRACNQVRP